MIKLKLENKMNVKKVIIGIVILTQLIIGYYACGQIVTYLQESQAETKQQIDEILSDSRVIRR